MSATILHIERLVKSFRSNWSYRRIDAVRDVSLEVFRGESFGFLGHNGAGKTTTLKCIVGLLNKTSGRIFFDGEILEKASQHQGIGYLPELPYFYDHLSVEETLDFFAALNGIPGTGRKKEITSVLERVGLAERRSSAVSTLSKGLQQRLGFAQAIINRPALLLLDEPFSGLDPSGRREMRELIHELKEQGTTVFLSSHILSDVEEICERVSIMSQGVLKSVFYLKDIPSLFGERFELTVLDDPNGRSAAALAAVHAAATHSKTRRSAEGELRIFQFDESEKANFALQALAAAGSRIMSFQSLGLKLEEIFLKITAENAERPKKEAETPRPAGAPV